MESQSRRKQKRKRSKLTLAVRDFALPLRRHGSLGSSNFSSLPIDLGQEIHQLIQARLLEEGGYQAEYPLQTGLRGENHDLQIRGRADGFFEADPPLLEEIKSSFGLPSLKQALHEEADHPYILQVKVYAYIFHQRTGRVPTIRLRLVDSRSFQEELWPVAYDPEEFENWVHARLQQIEEDLLRYAALLKTRKRLAKKLDFPFSARRAQQDELLQKVASTVAANRNLLLQAPTGLGKTAGVLYPALCEGLAKGNPVVYIAPKNSQFKAAIDLAKIFQKQRIALKVLVLTSKAKACRQEEVNCQGSVCSFARDYFDKVDALGLAQRDAKKHLWDGRYFQGMADLHEVCPYEVGMERIREADLIICDYNYIASPRANFFDRYLDPILPMTKPILVIDEAHNLYERVMENFSAEIRLSSLKTFLAGAASAQDERFAAVVRQALSYMTSLNPGPSAGRITLDAEGIAQILQMGLELMTSRWGKEGLPGPEDPLFQFFTQWHDLDQLSKLSREAVPIIYKREGGDEILRAQCIDPSSVIAPLLGAFRSVIAFSATLKPFDFYLRVSGFDSDTTDIAEFESPFPRDHKKIMIIPQVQTNYRERDRHYQRIAAIITRIVSLKPGPYLAFFPSYQFLAKVRDELPPSADWSYFIQRASASPSLIKSMEAFIQDASGPSLILAVQGGSLSEGIDLRGRGLLGVFIVGPAVPNASFERQLMQDHYEAKYGKGRAFAYVYPAMTRSVQAAGRIVRDEEERGLIVLMDPRFLQEDFAATMPRDWFASGVTELLPKSILTEVQEFWDGARNGSAEETNEDRNQDGA